MWIELPGNLVNNAGWIHSSKIEWWVHFTRLFITGMFSLYVCAQSDWLFATPWTAACQAPLPKGFSRQEYWSVLPLPPPGESCHPRIKHPSPLSPALASRFFTTEPPVFPCLLIWTSGSSPLVHSTDLFFFSSWVWVRFSCFFLHLIIWDCILDIVNDVF